MPKRFRIVPEESLVAVYARSNVGPIRWEGTTLQGGFDAEVAGSAFDMSLPPAGRMELALEKLTSGNPVYDAELMRRLDARRYPVAVAELRFLDTMGPFNRYQAQGELTLHGVTRDITGTLEVEFDGEGTITVFGEKVVDIRDFAIPSPTLLMLKIYPDVRVRMKIVAESES